MHFSETLALKPIEPAYHLRIFSDEHLADFKSATLEILEEVGIQCHSEKALHIYADHGATVDFGTGIVKIPPTGKAAPRRPFPLLYLGFATP